MADPFANYASGLDSPGDFVLEIVPDDGNDLPTIGRGLYVGTGGNVKITTRGGTTATFRNVPAGTLLPEHVKRLWATGTTASDFITTW